MNIKTVTDPLTAQLAFRSMKNFVAENTVVHQGTTVKTVRDPYDRKLWHVYTNGIYEGVLKELQPAY